MKNGYRRVGWSWGVLAAAVLLVAGACAQQAAPRLDYPQTRKVDHVDTYHGAQVPDPYRWLEDDNSPETADVGGGAEQGHLRLPGADPVPGGAARRGWTQLYNYPKYSAPSRKGDATSSSRKNDGLQNQSVLYIQKGLDGAPEVLIDPNTLVRRTARRGWRASRCRRTASTPSTASRAAGRTGRNTT